VQTPTPAPRPSPATRQGNELAYARADGTIWLASADGSEQRELISEAMGENAFVAASAVEWSPDGKYLAYPTQRGTLELLDVDSGEQTTLDDGEDGFVSDAPPPEWTSPTTIAYYKTPNTPAATGRKLWVASIDGGRSAAPGTSVKCIPSTPSCDFAISGRATEGPNGRALYLVRRSSGEEQFLTSHGAVLGWSWSPDGRWLAYYDNARGGSTMTGEVHIREAESGRDIELGTFNTDERTEWAPSRDRLIFYNLEIDPAAGAVTQLFDRPSANIAWSPDLSKVAFVEGDIWGKGTLVALDLETGRRTELLTINTGLSHPQVPGLWSVWSPDGRYLSFSGVIGWLENDREVYLFHSNTGLVSYVLTLVQDSSVSYSPDWSRLLIARRLYDGDATMSVAGPDGASPAAIDEGVPLRQAWRPTAGGEP
jgi:Tol biopolymer transport system component